MALLAGFMPGTGVASDTRVVEKDIGYTCAFPSGEDRTDVTVSAELPSTSGVGVEVQPENVHLELTVPRAMLGEPSSGGTPRLSGSARLATTVTQHGVPTTVMWQGLDIAESSVAPDEDVVIRAAGEVPTVTPRSSGDLVFAADRLDMDLTLRSADRTTAEPVTLTVSCTVDADQEPELAGVRVPAPAGDLPAAPATPELPWERGLSADPRSAAPGAGAGADGPHVPIPPGCTLVYGPVDNPPRAAHGYMAGYSNVKKQNAAMAFREPGHLRLQLNSATAAYTCPKGSLTWLKSSATLDYRGKAQMPPARSTFLTFGFMPTTATVELELVGPTTIDTLSEGPDPVTRRRPETTTAISNMSVRLYDVKVNGTPLDVGPDCRTARPMKLVLTGKGSTGRNPAAEGYTVMTGGPLIGTADIPEFTGCGVTEDLDNVFTAAVSGKGNYTKMTQGALCVDGVPANCPEPPRPRPER
ncbi:DUF6801 domain-containing protein [Streptomyces sp. NPDC015032]|uniref:DUF6801 domain-containing protein n=1 Tax=Streptomyces sp. NPDC015032 TaxID=3364937 RepID=UPI003702F890